MKGSGEHGSWASPVYLLVKKTTTTPLIERHFAGGWHMSIEKLAAIIEILRAIYDFVMYKRQKLQ